MNSDDPAFDPWCDPSNPRRVTYDDIVEASNRIKGAILKTPCSKSHLSEKFGVELYLKQEFLQHTGSFKERGARNTLLQLSDEQKQTGVVCASSGNHGQAISYHSTQLGIPAIVVMPVTAPIVKITKCENYGAKVIQHGNNIGDSKVKAMALCKDKGMVYVNGYDHPHVIAGQGTIGLEVLEQVPGVQVILVPVGGGSLLGGICTAVKHLKPNTQIYGIETDKCASMVLALRNGEPTRMNIDTTIADGLSVPLVGVNSFHTVKPLVDKMIVVKEDWVARAILNLVDKERFVVEGAGATGVATLLAGLVPELKGKKVVAILSGGNIDTTTLGRCLERGMAAEGRLVKFKVRVSDRPGGMAEICRLLADMGIAIKDMIPERAWVKGDIFSVELKVLCETRDLKQTAELKAKIEAKYKDSYFPEMGEGGESKPQPKCPAVVPKCMFAS